MLRQILLSEAVFLNLIQHFRLMPDVDLEMRLPQHPILFLQQVLQVGRHDQIRRALVPK